MRRLAVLLCACAALTFAEKYDGPRPPKADVVYLLHASNLVSTDAVEAREQTHRGTTIYVVPGEAATARTPLAEPIFLLQSSRLSPESLQLYRLEAKNGERQIVFPKNQRSGPRPVPLSVKRLDDGLYRVEVNEMLDNGQYALSPEGSNQVFCFEIY